MDARTSLRSIGAAVGAAALVAMSAGAAIAAAYDEEGTGTVSSSNPPVGGTMTAQGGGMAPGEDVDSSLFSKPVLLSTVKADANGNYTTTFKLPAGKVCQHEIVSEGRTSGHRNVNRIVIGNPADCPGLGGGGELPHTGSQVAQIAGMAFLGVGLVGTGVTLRRRAKAKI